MIIHRAFYREALEAMVGITLALVIVVLLFGITATLGRAVRGDYPQGIVLALIGWETLRRVDILLPLGFYLGVLATFSRWYRDSEMAVLAACGVGLGQLLRPVMLFALCVSVVVGGTAFWLTPFASRAIDEVKAESNQRPQVTGIAPGAFSESAAGGRILYAQEVDDEGAMHDVFISNSLDDRPRVVLAKSGRSFIDRVTGRRRIELSDGWAYEGTPALADYRVVHFDHYTVWLDQKPIVPPPETTAGLRTGALLHMPGLVATAEWHWRLAKPVHVFVLALFAMVLARTDARRGRAANVFGAILVYFIYSNLIGIGETVLQNGQVPAVLGMWWIHGTMLAIALFLFYRRSRNLPLMPRRAVLAR